MRFSSRPPLALVLGGWWAAPPDWSSEQGSRGELRGWEGELGEEGEEGGDEQSLRERILALVFARQDALILAQMRTLA